MSDAAARNGVFYVPVVDTFVDHEICGNGGEYLSGITLTNINDLFHGQAVGTGSFHPNSEGVDAYASTINAFLVEAQATLPLRDTGLPRNPDPSGSVANRQAAEASDPQVDDDFTFDLLYVEPLAGDVRAACYPDEGGLVRAGGQFAVYGEGFAPGTSVQVSWDTATTDVVEPPVIATLEADSSGRIDGVVDVPADALTDSSALVVATGAAPTGDVRLVSFVGVAASCPGTEPAAAGVVVSDDLHLTNALTVDGTGATHVSGDLRCDSQVKLAGDVVVAGAAYLTNSCEIGGSLVAGGAVEINSTARIGGDLDAGGNVRFQSSAQILGDVRTSGSFEVIDAVSIDELRRAGRIGGEVSQHETLPTPNTVAWSVGAVDLDAVTLGWTSWMNQIAAANAAPSWSQGLSANPGCVMAPWASSVNGEEVEVLVPTVLDARSSTSGCSQVTLQSMTLSLGADLTVYADGLRSINGLRVESMDGQPHTLSVIIPGDVPSCSSGGAIDLSAGTTSDPLIRTTLHAPGRVTLQHGSSLTGTVAAGCVSSSGTVVLNTGAEA